MRHPIFAIMLTCVALCTMARQAVAQDPEDASLSILDSLLNVPVSAAAKHTQLRSEAPASITVVTAEEIAHYGYRSLQDVFRHAPGFYVTDDLNYSYVGSRGFSRPGSYNHRLLLLVDGHTMNTNFNGAWPFGASIGVDLDAVERIEIVRGPGSSLYGTGAMFAVVNVVTKTGKQIGGFESSVEGGNLGTRAATLSLGERFADDLDIALSLTGSNIDGADLYFPEFDSPATNLGVAEDLNWTRSYGAHAALRRGGLRVAVSHSWRATGIPTAPRGAVFNDPDAETSDRLTYVDLQYETTLTPDKLISVRAYGNHVDHGDLFPLNPDAIINYQGAWLGTESRFQWDISPRNRLSIGFEAQDHLKAHLASQIGSGDLFGGDYTYHGLSFYAQDEWQLTTQVSVTAGMRADWLSGRDWAMAPRVALVFHPTSTSTGKLLYGEAFRHPQALELELHTPEYGLLANPSLRPERIRTAELVWEQRLGRRVFARSSGFYYRVRDLTEQILVDTPDSLLQWGAQMLQYNNVSAATAFGAEFEMSFVLPTGVSAYGSYTLQHGEDRARSDAGMSDDDLSNSPRHMLKWGGIVPVRGWATVGVNFVYESSRRTVRETRTSDYFLSDICLSSGWLWERLSLRASAKNVFDAHYHTPGGFEHIQAAIPQRGRTIVLELKYRP